MTELASRLDYDLGIPLLFKSEKRHSLHLMSAPSIDTLMLEKRMTSKNGPTCWAHLIEYTVQSQG